MGYPMLKAKAAAAPALRTNGAREMVMVAGVLTCGLSIMALGLQIFASWVGDAHAPAWVLSFALFFVGIGVTTLSLLPPLFESPEHSPTTRRRRRWIHYAITRAALAMVAINMPLAAYMAGLAQVARLPDWLILGISLAANLLALVIAVGTTPGARPRQLAALEESTLLRWHAAALDVDVRCPYCSTEVSPGGAACCRSCETLHHQECWREFGGCSVFACGDHAAQAMDGRPV